MSETTTATPTLQDVVTAAFEAKGTYSPYEMIGVVNKLLTQFKVDKTLPTQMGYQYANKGYIKSSKSTRTTKAGKVVETVTVSAEDAVEWAVKYLGKNTAK